MAVSWKVEDAGPKTPEWNMEVDRLHLVNIQSESRPQVRFYEWSTPSVTYGYFVDPWDHFHQEAVEKAGIILARRPTGGGIIFHQGDFAFSITVPSTHPFYQLNSLDSYLMINSCIMKAVNQVFDLQGLTWDMDLHPSPRGGFCMAHATPFDLLWCGKKVGGAAQRKTKNGLLHQGSLLLHLPDEDLLGIILKNGEAIFNQIKASSGALADASMDLSSIRATLKREVLHFILDSASSRLSQRCVSPTVLASPIL